MKKLVLIDDNIEHQREAYGASFVDNEEYSDCLIHIEKVNSQSDLSFLNDVACVMIHDSLADFIDGKYLKPSRKAKERIEDVIQDNNIPYVIFSDGHSMTADWREETPNIIYAIKKSEFYRHLRAFVDYYRSSMILDLRILAYGEDFLKQMMSKWCLAVMSSTRERNDDELLEINMLDRRSLRQIIENAQPKVGISFDDLMAEIEDENITVGQLRSNINNILKSVKKYGKNISSWK